MPRHALSDLHSRTQIEMLWYAAKSHSMDIEKHVSHGTYLAKVNSNALNTACNGHPGQQNTGRVRKRRHLAKHDLAGAGVQHQLQGGCIYIQHHLAVGDAGDGEAKPEGPISHLPECLQRCQDS